MKELDQATAIENKTPWTHRGTKPARWYAETAMWARLAQGLQIDTVLFGACGSFVFHATGNLDPPHRVFEFCIPVEASMDVVVSFSVAVVRSSEFIVDRTE